ncbi:MAG: hypothetical protein V1755_02880 [Chloroflexota bacterium]
MPGSDLKTQHEAVPKSGRRRLWFILGVIVLALSIMGVAVALALVPAIRSAVRGTGGVGSVVSLVGSPTAAVGRKPADTALPAADPVARPALGGLGDPDLKSDVWDTVPSFYRNVRDCPDVSGVAI